MNKLTDEQQELITYLPKGFKGTKLDKLTMAAFCYCNKSAIDRGEQTFTLPYTKLSELTGYGRTMLSKAVHKLCRDNGITCLKTGNYITHTSTEYAVFNVEKVNIESEHRGIKKVNIDNQLEMNKIQKVNIESEHRDVQNSKVNTKYKFKYKFKNNIDNYTETNSTIDDSTEREKERNNNNTLNSTTDMLMFTERLVLLSKEIEALKSENESLKVDIKSLKVDIKSLKVDNKTLNERLNKAAKIIKELKEEVNTLHTSTDSTKEVNLNDSEIWNFRREFSDQFNIAKNPNANMSERLMAAKIMNSIAEKHPDILTEKQHKAAKALLHMNDNTNVEIKSETNAEVRGMQDHSFTKESAYALKEWQESYKAFRMASGNTDVTKDELKEKAQVFINKSNEVKAYIDSGEVPNKFIAEFKKATEPQDGLRNFEYDKALRLTEEETQE